MFNRNKYILAGIIDLLGIVIAYKLLPHVIYSMYDFLVPPIQKHFIWFSSFTFSNYTLSWLITTLFISIASNAKNYLSQSETKASNLLLITSIFFSVLQLIAWFLLNLYVTDILAWYLIFTENSLPWQVFLPFISIIVFISTEILRQRANRQSFQVSYTIQKSSKPSFSILVFLMSYLVATICFFLQMLSIILISGVGIGLLDKFLDWIYLGLVLIISGIFLYLTEFFSDKASTFWENYLQKLSFQKQEE